MKLALSALVCLISVLGAAHAAPLDDLPAFVATPGDIGEITVWGDPSDGGLLADWQAGFRKFHPDAHLATKLHGPDSTMAGVYTGVADLALMAREMRKPVERMAFEWEYHYPSLSIQVANGGLTADRLSSALAVFVQRGNPLTGLTLAQLDGILGSEHRQGGTLIRRWGDLGFDADWRDRPIHIYGPAVDSVAAAFVRDSVLKGSYKWNADYSQFPEDGAAILAALAKDPDGIAYAPLRAGNDSVKVVALGGVTPSRDSLIRRSYPLARSITMVLNRPPGKPVDPKVKEFLRYILSRDGQEAILRDGAYLPLSEADLRRQSALLE